MSHTREWILHEYEAKKHHIKSKDPLKEIAYPNQKEATAEIFQAFMVEDKVAVTLIALPQAGKTGTFLEVAYQMCTFNDESKAVDPEQILFLTGMSDRDWQKQTEDDMLTAFKKRVKHRGRFDSLPTLLSTIRNSVIVLDECHVAAGKEQSLSSILKDAGLLDIQTLRERRIFFLEVSATPGHTLYDMLNWGPENHGIVILKESPLYVGFRDFIRENRLRQSLELTKVDECEKLMNIVAENFPEPCWNIIRVVGANSTIQKVRENLATSAHRRGWEVVSHNSMERIGDIDYIMSTKPRSHRFIVIKEFWRAGKRLCDKYLGIVHEPKTKIQDTNITSQGLVGRLCGNDKKKGAGAPIAFCDTELIHDYLHWIDVKGDWSRVLRYKSKAISVKGGRITHWNHSWGHHTNVDGVNALETPEDYLLSDLFENREAAHMWANEEINWAGAWNTGGQHRPSNVDTHGADGNAGTTHIHSRGGLHPIQTAEEFQAQRDYSRFGAGVRCVPVLMEGDLCYVVVYKRGWKV
uniref:Helicase/UvrB N-terminal domain-containing protein n=1 Tax=viral metagenome TaxID=1070528 RepID=A0A6C0BCT2_9ZZZZ